MKTISEQKAKRDRDISVIDDRQLRKMIRQEVIEFLSEQADEVEELNYIG